MNRVSGAFSLPGAPGLPAFQPWDRHLSNRYIGTGRHLADTSDLIGGERHRAFDALAVEAPPDEDNARRICSIG